MSTNPRAAFVSTLHSDQPIVIESMADEHFFFLSDAEYPLETTFLKDPQDLKNGIKRPRKFEVIEVEKTGDLFKYYAVFPKNKFDFDEWEKKHRKK